MQVILLITEDQYTRCKQMLEIGKEPYRVVETTPVGCNPDVPVFLLINTDTMTVIHLLYTEDVRKLPHIDAMKLGQFLRGELKITDQGSNEKSVAEEAGTVVGQVVNRVKEISVKTLGMIASSIKNFHKPDKPVDLDKADRVLRQNTLDNLPKEYYAAIIEREGKYEVTFPNFPNIYTYGCTATEAIKNAQDALNGCIESDIENGFYNMPYPTQYVAIPVTVNKEN